MLVEPLDLLQRRRERVIACYLLETADGTALFDCGPASCSATLNERLRERGLELTDIRHLLLSHIHLDHAGAAGVLVREHPGLRVHVSEIGAPHLVDPSKLISSATRLYGDQLTPLWGEIAPIPVENVHVVGEQVLGLECFPSPGHASHHVCYLHGDGTLYAGDAAGVRIEPARSVLPPTPPPDVDVEGWQATIERIRGCDAERLALIHFGVFEDVGRHLDELERRLDAWTGRVRDGATEREFVDEVLAELGPEVDFYTNAMPLEQSYAGLKRYVDKRAEAA